MSIESPNVKIVFDILQTYRSEQSMTVLLQGVNGLDVEAVKAELDQNTTLTEVAEQDTQNLLNFLSIRQNLAELKAKISQVELSVKEKKTEVGNSSAAYQLLRDKYISLFSDINASLVSMRNPLEPFIKKKNVALKMYTKKKAAEEKERDAVRLTLEDLIIRKKILCLTMKKLVKSNKQRKK